MLIDNRKWWWLNVALTGCKHNPIRLHRSWEFCINLQISGQVLLVGNIFKKNHRGYISKAVNSPAIRNLGRKQ